MRVNWPERATLLRAYGMWLLASLGVAGAAAIVACGNDSAAPGNATPDADVDTDANADAGAETPDSQTDVASERTEPRDGGPSDAHAPSDGPAETDGGPTLPPLPPGTGTGTTYYVSPTGSDTNDGKSMSTPWQTLDKVTSTAFGPGDSVLFQGGATFTGCPVFSGSLVTSTATAPFTVGSYGTGRFTVQANCSGTRKPAVSISGINGFYLHDCKIVGNSGGAEYGVWINNPTSTVTDYVRVEACDISGFYSPSTSDFGGEIFVDGIPGGLNRVLLLDNTLHGSSGKTSPDDNGITGYGNGENITNALYQGNTVYDIGGKGSGLNGCEGNGIIAAGVNGATVQYNVVHDCGGNTTTCGGPGGIWAANSNAVTIQYNEVYGYGPAGSPPSGACDWNGYDLDLGVTNSTIQYNYSHDNYGIGFLAYINGTWSGNTFRYNIGQNDGTEFAFAGYQASTNDVAIYNNSFFNHAASQNGLTVGVAGGGTIAGLVANNVFYSENGAALVNDLSWNTATITGLTFVGNDYYATGAFGITWAGTNYSSLNAWASGTGEEMTGGSLVGLSEDPKMKSPGTATIAGGYVASALSGYDLQSGSPLVGVGIDLHKADGIDAGSHDYFGNPIPNKTGTGYDVGAYGGP